MLTYPLAFLGAGEMILIGIVALLIFGRRLPEVARSLGKGVVEFKRGLRDIEDEVDDASSRPAKARELPHPVPDKPAIQPVEDAVPVGGEKPSTGSA